MIPAPGSCPGPSKDAGIPGEAQEGRKHHFFLPKLWNPQTEAAALCCPHDTARRKWPWWQSRGNSPLFPGVFSLEKRGSSLCSALEQSQRPVLGVQEPQSQKIGLQTTPVPSSSSGSPEVWVVSGNTCSSSCIQTQVFSSFTRKQEEIPGDSPGAGCPGNIFLGCVTERARLAPPCREICP